MGFLLFLRKYWGEVSLVIIMTMIFFCGWHLRGIQDIEKEQRAIIAQTEKADKIAVSYEDTVVQENRTTENLNQQLKVTYAETGNRCPIPADRLRLIQQANR